MATNRNERTRLARYSSAAMVSQADHKLALDHIAALLDREAEQ
jgi:hypothetical protein